MSKRIAVMQPYFLPYLGYWQMLNAVDKFVLLDDVNFIKKGWINRNRILLNGDAHLMGIPLNKASQNLKIDELVIADDTQWRQKTLKSIRLAYSKAPYFSDVFPLIEDIFTFVTTQLNAFLTHSILIIKNYLKIGTSIVHSSQSYTNQDLRGSARIIDICGLENATAYINAPGGRKLYSVNDFAEVNVNLQFIETTLPHYTQFKNEFIPGLSILDVLMFNPKSTVIDNLEQYTLKTS